MAGGTSDPPEGGVGSVPRGWVPAGWKPRRRFGWPRAVRLVRKPDHDAVHRGSGRVVLRFLVVRHARRPEPSPARFGWAVSRKIGNAVVRNRVRRWLREALRHERGDLAGVDVVFVARNGAGDAGANGIRDDVRQALTRLRKAR